MRFLALSFLFMALASCALSAPQEVTEKQAPDTHATGHHHHHGDDGKIIHHHQGETHNHHHRAGEDTHNTANDPLNHCHHHHDTSSSEESAETVTCTGAYEVQGCSLKEHFCGGANEAITCTRKCICKGGYARKGEMCVPMAECSHNVVRRATDCDDPNEVYLYCGSACPARCGDKPGDRVCSTNCVNGCFCKKGFVLNRQNKCVSPSKC